MSNLAKTNATLRYINNFRHSPSVFSLSQHLIKNNNELIEPHVCLINNHLIYIDQFTYIHTFSISLVIYYKQSRRKARLRTASNHNEMIASNELPVLLKTKQESACVSLC